MPSKTYSLDTNIILRFILHDEPRQYDKIIQLLSTPDIHFCISDQALIEAIHVLESFYELDRVTITKIIKILTKPLNIINNYDLFDAVFKIWNQHLSLSFVDCYLAEQAKANHTTPLFTFDKKLAHQHPSAQELK